MRFEEGGSGGFNLYLVGSRDRQPIGYLGGYMPQTRLDVTTAANALRADAVWQLVIVPKLQNPGRAHITSIEFIVRDPDNAFDP
jgi:hypothetical protein